MATTDGITAESIVREFLGNGETRHAQALHRLAEMLSNEAGHPELLGDVFLLLQQVVAAKLVCVEPRSATIKPTRTGQQHVAVA